MNADTPATRLVEEMRLRRLALRQDLARAQADLLIEPCPTASASTEKMHAATLARQQADIAGLKSAIAILTSAITTQARLIARGPSQYHQEAADAAR